MCKIDVIKEICNKHGIHLIEDCAQSHFSEYNGVKAGLTGIAGSFSFYPGKNLGAYGDAGCIITNDDALAKNCKMFANHGALIKHQHQIEGINSRLDGLQAAILSAKLPFVKQWTEARINVANTYAKLLKDIPEITIPSIRPNSKHSFHLFVIRAKRRNELMEFLKSNYVECALHYPTPLPFLECYKKYNYTPDHFPVSYQLKDEILSLPIYPELTKEQIIFLTDLIRKFYS
jgi:dTDP-4-amino-4,6-dideoxygalactose transaminase